MKQLLARSNLRALCVVALSAILAGGCAQVPPPAVSSAATAEEGKPSLPKIAEAFRFVLLSGTKDCSNAGSTCTVDVKMSKLTRGTDTYCLAEAPAEIVFSRTQPGNPTKTIVWRLVPKDASFNLTVEFQEHFGILVLKNDKGQIDSGRRTQKTEYEVKNKHKETGTSVYLPIILQIGGPGEEPKMCAAADPKIVNN